MFGVKDLPKRFPLSIPVVAVCLGSFNQLLKKDGGIVKTYKLTILLTMVTPFWSLSFKRKQPPQVLCSLTSNDE